MHSAHELDLNEEEKGAESTELGKGEGEGHGALRCMVSLPIGLLFSLAAYPSPSQFFSWRFCVAFPKLPPSKLQERLH